MTLDGQIDTSLIQSMAGLDVPWLLRQWSERTPDKPFLIWEPFNGDSRSWSYRPSRLSFGKRTKATINRT
jgi:crotonobetaine/carnitine-CoA ligase